MLASVAFLLTSTTLVLATSSTKHLVRHEWRNEMPAGWIKIGDPFPSLQISLRIALPSRDFATLEKALYNVSTPGSDAYGHHLSFEQVRAYMAPLNESVSAVKDWLSTYGIAPTTLPGHGDWLGFSTTVEKASALFGAQFATFKHTNTGREQVRTMAYSVPADLKPHIELVYPMISFSNPRMGRHTATLVTSARNVAARAAPSACSDPFSVTPACILALYGIPTSPAKSSNNSITVTGYVNEFAQSADLKAFLTQYRPDMSSLTTFKLETLDNGSNPQGTSDAGLEADLDTQYTIGIATSVPVYFLSVGQPTDSLGGLLDTINFISAKTPISNVVTTSYSYNENSISLALATKLCNAYAAAGSKGVSLLFSSGDGGVTGTKPGNCTTTFVPTFPDGCPYITSVGATQDFPEIAAGFSSGGFSNYFPLPSYQASQVKSYIKGLDSSYSGKFNASGRGFPDVAAYGYTDIVLSGENVGVYGTSCSTPIFASIIALLNDGLIAAKKPPLGFLNPWLYSTAASAFTDITSGQNYGCSSGPGFSAKTGWDPVTGLGTPNFAKLKKAAGL